MKKNHIYKLTQIGTKTYLVFETEDMKNISYFFAPAPRLSNKIVDICHKDHLLKIKRINYKGESFFLHLKTNSLIIESDFYIYRVT